MEKSENLNWTETNFALVGSELDHQFKTWKPVLQQATSGLPEHRIENCDHPRRCYNPQPKLNEPLQFHCYDCCRKIDFMIPWSNKLTLRDIYHCWCTDFGLPTFSVLHYVILSPFSGAEEYWIQLTCVRCSFTFIQLPDVEGAEMGEHPYRRLLTTGVKGKEFNRVKVEDIRQLFQSDHVYWVRYPLKYEHHASILLCQPDGDTFEVVHYSPAQNKRRGAECKRQVMSFSKEKLHMYKVEYLPLDNYLFHETLERAKESQGEIFYNLLTNNCEHFVRRIKSGQSTSYQVDNMPWIPRFAGNFKSW